jgi:hypothetical protein
MKVVAAMKLHGARRGVQFRGCIALYFLAKYGGHSTRALLRDAKAAAAQVCVWEQQQKKKKAMRREIGKGGEGRKRG